MPSSKANVRRESVAALLRLLQDIPRSAEDKAFDHIPLDVLRSQGALAKFSLPQEMIVGMSLNTLKTAANSGVIGGFGALNKARQVALETLEARRARLGRPGRQTKKALNQRVSESNTRAGLLRQDLNHMTGALKFAMARMREYANASNNPALVERLRGDLEEVRARAAPAVTLLSSTSQ